MSDMTVDELIEALKDIGNQQEEISRLDDKLEETVMSVDSNVKKLAEAPLSDEDRARLYEAVAKFASDTIARTINRALKRPLVSPEDQNGPGFGAGGFPRLS